MVNWYGSGYWYPLEMTNISIENDHRDSGFSHQKWVDLSTAMWNWGYHWCDILIVVGCGKHMENMRVSCFSQPDGIRWMWQTWQNHYFVWRMESKKEETRSETHCNISLYTNNYIQLCQTHPEWRSLVKFLPLVKRAQWFPSGTAFSSLCQVGCWALLWWQWSDGIRWNDWSSCIRMNQL